MTNKQYPDLEGNLPGEEGYNVIGAQVRYADETTGIKHEHHPKYGVVPVKSLRTGLNVQVSGAGRDRLNAELARAEAIVRD